MEVNVYKDEKTLSAEVADMIIECVKSKPGALLCFATGDSPRLAYRLLAEKVIKDKIDFSKCFIIGLDEWMGISPNNTGSCHWFLHEHLIGPMNISSSQVHLFDAFAKDEAGECDAMNRLIAAKGGVDLMVVGVGMNGHVGFNEPGTDIHSLAHVAVLDETTVTVGRKYFTEKVTIDKGFTLGLKQVMAAGKLVMMANGARKAPIIKKTVEDNIGNQFPATLIQKHKNGFLMIDQAAASELKTEFKWHTN